MAAKLSLITDELFKRLLATQDRVILFLISPEGHPSELPEMLIETHCAFVFLAGDGAPKIYHIVIAVTCAPSGELTLNGTGEPVEWVLWI